ncbi:MAG: hypothetical protein V6Z86_05670 [Hyphomicrobiales bacterium]
MKEFIISGAMAIRAYGCWTVNAESLDDAKAIIASKDTDMNKIWQPHGSGNDDFDLNYNRPSIYLDSVSVTHEDEHYEESELSEDLPTEGEANPLTADEMANLTSILKAIERNDFTTLDEDASLRKIINHLTS